MKHKPKIIIDIERMKYPYTGLYFFSKNLGVNMLRYFSDTFDIHFFSHSKAKVPKFFNKILYTPLDKIFLYKFNKHDLWHVTWQNTRFFPKHKTKIVYTIHDLNFLYTDKPDFKKNKLLKDVQEKIDKADSITAISNYVKADIEKHLDLKGKDIEVIYNGVEVNKYPNFDAPRYKPKKKFLFTVGTVLYKKHFHVLPCLLVGNNYELIISGIDTAYDYIDSIWKIAEEYGVKDRLHLTGPISDKEKYWYMKHAEAFLFPSISEGFGLPPIEAMRLGKPVFLSTFTSLPEIGGNVAYYFQNFEPEHMQKVLNEGLKDYYENDRKESIIAWSKQFTWQEAVKKYAKVYQKTLNIPITNGVPKEKKKITAIIPTFNEENNIEQAIQQVQWADEILVIDSYSTDETVSIAKKIGAKVIQRVFDNFSSQKNYAIEQAKYDWIFILDADERISDDLKLEIENKLFEPEIKTAYWIPRTNYFSKIKVNYSAWQNDKVIRFFNRKYARYNGKLVHEEIQTNAPIGLFKNPIIHYTCNDIEIYKKKISSYAKLKAKELYMNGVKPNFYRTHIKPFYRFIYHYIIQFGILDGKIGWKIAKINAYGMRKRYKILKELYAK